MRGMPFIPDNVNTDIDRKSGLLTG
jgi:hypothetical protein